MKKLAIGLFVLLKTATVFASQNINTLVNAELTNKNIPSIAISVISFGKIVHIGAYGLRDVENNKTANIDTPYHIASVSKTVTGMAIFHLLQNNRVSLHEDINVYLPFKVVNPHHPNDKITIAELLNHTSGILDNERVYLPYWSNPVGDPKERLESFLKRYLVKGGKHYSSENYEKIENYKVYDYSNTGYALLGLIIEHVSGVSFNQYLTANLFTALNMTNSSYLLSHMNEDQVSKTYSTADETLVFKGFNGYPDFPAGLLRTSIRDYTNLILAYFNANKGTFPLKQSTTSLMTPNININDKDKSFTWFLDKVNSTLYYQHGGADLGARAEVIMEPTKKNAVIIFTNSEADLTPLLKQVESMMFKN